MKHRILHTEWSDGWGGQERRIVTEMEGMKARGHGVLLATRPQARIAEEARARGIGVETLPFAGKLHLSTIAGLVRLIRREGIGIVDTHSGIDSWCGGLAAGWAGAALVRTRHLNIPLRRNPFNFVHYLPDRVVACGEQMRRTLVEDCGFPARKVVSIPTGIAFGSFRAGTDRATLRARIGLAEGDWMVLMVGILRSVKRHELAFEALARLRDELPAMRLVLAGDGPCREALREHASTSGVADRVIFLGHREDVPDLLAASDALLLSSRSEGVPQAVTQALGCGLPVVATRVGGVPELVIHERTGLLAQPGDAAGIAEALLRLARDPVLALRLGTAGREHVQRHFSLDAMLDATERLFDEIAAGRCASSRAVRPAGRES
ncbi:MAG: hypothetical protein COW56_10360 [Rhodocyclales bacterium CG17_big_fil_post_rev_8_21_14_2_50_68_7]|nr:MAG: hypothetical protein COW56_10360 [Rhodocyclales bacterium CG17_big_fil_post_rev_8_21_14_2_50_68_7]